mmetsp:Transcript_29167/g.73275  ORF Transcript_29167/g.73275 Transcript_29167/m.73275 type:complete len:209 (+) Transcript_29167:2518-3144(+)
MLPACATKARQHVRRAVVALHLRHCADGAAHRLVGDLEEAVGNFVQALGGLPAAARLVVDVRRQLLKCSARAVHIQRLVLSWPKDLGEQLGLDAAQQQVGVRHRQVPVLPVADRPWVRARALGAHRKHAVAQEEARAAARRDGVDVQLRRLDGHPRGGGLKDVLVGAGKAGDVRGGAAHVKADDLQATRVHSLPAGGQSIANNAASGT